MRLNIPKALLIIPLLIVAAVVVAAVNKAADAGSAPITIERHGLLPELTLKDLKSEATLIVVATAGEAGAARWSTADGKLPPNTTADSIPDNMLIFTDTPVHIERYLKGATKQPDILVRTLGGTIGNVELIVDSRPKFQKGERVVLFLETNEDETANIGPQHYVVVGAVEGSYKIEGDQAVSINDSLPLTSLINAVQAK